jgi:hypothetical protein
MRTRWEHELRQYEYNLGRAAVASAISSHGADRRTQDRKKEGTDRGEAEHGSEVRKNSTEGPQFQPEKFAISATNFSCRHSTGPAIRVRILTGGPSPSGPLPAYPEERSQKASPLMGPTPFQSMEEAKRQIFKRTPRRFSFSRPTPSSPLLPSPATSPPPPHRRPASPAPKP